MPEAVRIEVFERAVLSVNIRPTASGLWACGECGEAYSEIDDAATCCIGKAATDEEASNGQ